MKSGNLDKLIISLWFFSLLLVNNSILSQNLILDKRMYHLRIGNRPEWSDFHEPAKRQLIISFSGKQNASEQTLRFRQQDVKQTWRVVLNGKELDKLQQDEHDMIVYLPVPAGILINGKNILSFQQADTITDDVRIGEISLMNQPVKELMNEAEIKASVNDGKSKSYIPARITITNSNHSLHPVGAVSDQHLAVRTGCVYTGDGNASFGVPEGKYIIYATRGFEYGVDSAILLIKKGDHAELKFAISNEVPTEGWISCDTHIHTLTYSGHGDATVTERVLTIAGEGIDFPIITEHNKFVSIDSLSRLMKLRNYFTPVVGDEFTTVVGHFNIFPMDINSGLPEYKVKDWNAVSRNLGGINEGRVIILNHARDIHNGFRPFGPEHHIAVAGLGLDESIFPANGMEVLNSGSTQTDIMQLYKDWFGMMNHGYNLTPAGSSDSHDVIRYMVGQGRTYIKYNGDKPSQIDIRKATEQFLAGKVMISFGLLAEITVDNVYGPGEIVPASGMVKVSVRVLGPSWAKANRISLYANGLKIRERKIDQFGAKGLKWSGSWTIPVSNQDMFLVAIAEGPGRSEPFWSIPRPYQPASSEWHPKIIGSSGAVWIDADRDGKKTSAYHYAIKLTTIHREDFRKLLKELASYDETVSIQAAAILQKNGLWGASAMNKMLQTAAPIVRRGFQVFQEAWQVSEMARRKKVM